MFRKTTLALTAAVFAGGLAMMSGVASAAPGTRVLAPVFLAIVPATVIGAGLGAVGFGALALQLDESAVAVARFGSACADGSPS